MSTRRQSTKHIVCPAAAHLPIHVAPFPNVAEKSEVQQNVSFCFSLFCGFTIIFAGLLALFVSLYCVALHWCLLLA